MLIANLKPCNFNLDSGKETNGLLSSCIHFLITYKEYIDIFKNTYSVRKFRQSLLIYNPNINRYTSSFQDNWHRICMNKFGVSLSKIFKDM